MVLIKNFDALIQNARSPLVAEARRTVLTLLEAAISSVDPRSLIKNRVTLKEQRLCIGDLSLNLEEYDRILVSGAGKASGAMAEALEETLGQRIDAGLVNVPEGTAANFKTKTVKLQEAGHPIPNEEGLKGAAKIASLLENLSERTLVIFLLSGGGSALLPLPKQGVSLAEKKTTTDLLLRCGATIEEVNAVRKHISALKGGQLAVRTYPATLISLILSDIVCDPLPSIASGPTVPDPTTYADAIEVLQRYNVWEHIPHSVKKLLTGGQEGNVLENPKPNDPRFKRVHNILLGNNRFALDAAQKKASALGLSPLVLCSFIEGEARQVGTVFAGLAREMQVQGCHVSEHKAILAGGETTVTVKGNGRGGRNQELALSASLRLRDLEGIALASAGTDGIDGLSSAAGAIVDGFTIERALKLKMNPFTYLANNDSHSFFASLGDGIITGPTGTNVNDIMIIVNLKGTDKTHRLSTSK